MKVIETYLNIIHFCFYKAHYKMHLLANKINPFHLIHKLPFQRRRYEKLGIDIYKEIDRAAGDKEFGVSTIAAGGILWGGVGFLFLSFLLLFNLIVYGTMLHVIIVSALSGIVCYFFVFRNDKYLAYFDKYEKWSKAEKRKYSWLTFASVVAVLLLFYIGLTT
ncbi:MAG: hypothetical protein EOO90_16945 [Pedobacter sp.]|nr:MAG: hypothetical protein EOO90_16945 [Pedobacter sp.]